MRYELYVRNNGSLEVTRIQTGDNYCINTKTCELFFSRGGKPIHIAHVGVPISGPGVLIKFPVNDEVGLVQQEIDSLNVLLRSLTEFEVVQVKSNIKHLLCFEFGDKHSEKVVVKKFDRIDLNTGNGDIHLRKGGAIFRQPDSTAVVSIELGSFISFIFDEVFGIVQLISALTQSELELVDANQVVLQFYATTHIVHVVKDMPERKQLEDAFASSARSPGNQKRAKRRKGKKRSNSSCPNAA